MFLLVTRPTLPRGRCETCAARPRYLKSQNPAVACYLIDPTGSGLKRFVETGRFAAVGGGCFIDGIGIMRETANFRTAVVDGAFRGDDREVGPSVLVVCMRARVL